MRQILCFSTTRYDMPPTRKQEVMRRLSDAEVLYFDPPVTKLARFKDKSAKAQGKRFSKERGGVPAPDAPHITVYPLPTIWPFYNKYRWINKINQRKIARYVRRVCAQKRFDQPALWLYHPMYADLPRHVPHTSVVYDCTDRHSSFPGFINPVVVDRMEADLARHSDIVFATAQGLYDTLKNYNPRTYMIPNGANFALFNKAATEDLPVPEDIRDIPRPILGFVGALQECIDYGLLRTAAETHREWSIVVIGDPNPGVNLDPLREFPNIHLLGRRPHAELPAYIRQFDVCLNLFRPGRLSRDVSPLKFYEYLATGKPIVSTPQPEQVLAYNEIISVVNSSDEFVAACQKAISQNTAWYNRRRIDEGRAAAWEGRLQQIEAALIKENVRF